MAKISGEEGYILYGPSTVITAASHAGGTVTVTAAGHGLLVKDKVEIAGVVGMTDINGTWVLTASTTNTFGITKTTAQSYTSDGTVRKRLEVTNWTANVAGEVIKTTDSGDSDWDTYIFAGWKSFDGTYEGFIYEGVNIPVIGTIISIRLLLDDGTNYLEGNGIFNSSAITANIPEAEAVKITGTFQGTATLTPTMA